MPKQFKEKLPGLPERLKAARKNAGYTQAEVADELDICLQAVCGWEYGRTEPTLLRLTKLAALYGASYEQLLDG